MAETPRKGSNVWIIVIVVGAILLLLLCGCLALLLGIGWLTAVGLPWSSRFEGIEIDGINPQVEVERRIAEAYNVDVPVLLEIDNEVGSIEIIGTDEGRVIAEAVIHGYGTRASAAQELADSVQVEITQTSDDQVRLVGNIPEGLRVGRSPKVDWIVRVPAQARLQVQNKVGEVQVRDLVGAANIQVDVGEIGVRNLVITDDTRLTTDVGRIHITLPRDSEFVLDAATGVGDIDSEFDVEGTAERRMGPSDALQGPVGTDPEVTLYLRTGTGEIVLLAD